MNVFTEVADDVTYVGYHKVESKIHKTYQILVRPDVSEDSLLSLAQQILITSSGAVTKHVPVSGLENTPDHAHRHANMISGEFNRASPSPTNANTHNSKDEPKTKGPEKLMSPYLEAINNTHLATSVPWQTIRVYLGVNMDLQRCLLLCVQPTSAAAGVNSVSSKLGGDVGVVQRSVVPGVFRGIGVNTYSHAAELNHTASSNVDNGASTTSANTNNYVTPARKSFLDYCETLAYELNTAMREESLTIDYISSVPASMTGPMQGLHNGGFSAASNRALDSLVDLAYIRDLQCATVQLMTLRLHEQADKLDFRTKIIEQKCARLMTLLKPSFVRAKLDLPVPPLSKSVLMYELNLEKTAIADSCSVDVWKLVLLRARRKCREVLMLRGQVALSGSGYSGVGSGSSSNNNSMYDVHTPDTRNETQIVLDLILEQFVTWAQGEYKQRLFRKINSVKDRLETIHHFRIQLILSLHERFVVNGTTNTNATSGWLFNSNPDLTYQRSIREKFPFLTLTEPVLFDTQAILLSGKYGIYDAAAATLNGKSGMLYLTLGYVMFYCGGGFLGTPAEIVVVPLHSVVLLELVNYDTTLVSFTYSSDGADSDSGSLENSGVGSDGREGLSIQQGEKSVNILSPVKTHPHTSTDTSNTTNPHLPLPPLPPSAKQPSTIRLVDRTHTTDVTLTVTGLTEDYVRRVADLLDLIIKDKLYKLREPHTTPFTHASSTTHCTGGSAASTYHTISDIDDILDLLALPTSGGDSTTAGGGENSVVSTDKVGGTSGNVDNSTTAGEKVSSNSVAANVTPVAPVSTTAANPAVGANSSNSVNHTPALTASTKANIPASTPSANIYATRPATAEVLVPTTTTTTATTSAASTSSSNTAYSAVSDADFDNLLLSTTHTTTTPTNTHATKSSVVPTTANSTSASNTATASAFGFINSSSVTTTNDVSVLSPFDTVPALLIPTPHTTNTISTINTTTNTAALPRTDSSHLLDLDNFYNELTIHTPTSSVGNTGTHTPTNASSMYGGVHGGVSASNSSVDVFGSDVLVPTSGVNGTSNNSSTNVLAYNNRSNSNSGNMLNTLPHSRSNNSISNINIDLATNPNASKSTGELFNDLIFGTVGGSSQTKAPSVAGPRVASPMSGAPVRAPVAGPGNSVVRTLTLTATTTSSGAVQPKPPVQVPTPAPTLAPVFIASSTPTPAPAVTAGAAPAFGTDMSGTTTTTATTTATATAAATVDQPAPAPVKKSLGGNIQKFLAQSQAQKAKQAAEAAKT